MTCVVDTVVFIAAYFPKEIHHKDGREIVEATQNHDIKGAFITDYIFDEIVTFVRRKKSPQASNEVIETLLDSPELKILKVKENHFEAAVHLFKMYHQLSFTDAVTLAMMKDTRTSTVYSFDRGFDAVPNIIRLTQSQK